MTNLQGVRSPEPTPYPYLFDTIPGIDPGPLPSHVPGFDPDPDTEPGYEPDPDPDPVLPPGPGMPGIDPGFPGTSFPDPLPVT